jgi:hypothetical protein
MLAHCVDSTGSDRPGLPADPWEPVLTYVSPSPFRRALLLAGPGLPRARARPRWNAPAGLTAESGRGSETSFGRSVPDHDSSGDLKDEGDELEFVVLLRGRESMEWSRCLDQSPPPVCGTGVKLCCGTHPARSPM